MWTVNDALIQSITLESEDKPEEIKEEPRLKEEDKKTARSALASRQALKKWKKRTKQLRVRKSVRVCLSRNNTIWDWDVNLGHKELGI